MYCRDLACLRIGVKYFNKQIALKNCPWFLIFFVTRYAGVLGGIVALSKYYSLPDTDPN